MNEEALQVAFEIFSSEGYNGSINDFKALIASNQEAKQTAFDLFAAEGYDGSIYDFSTLIGIGEVKKKEDSIPPSEEEASLESVTEPEEELSIPLDSNEEATDNEDLIIDPRSESIPTIDDTPKYPDGVEFRTIDIEEEREKAKRLTPTDTRSTGYRDPFKAKGLYPVQEDIDNMMSKSLMDKELTKKNKRDQSLTLKNVQRQEMSDALQRGRDEEARRYVLSQDPSFNADLERVSSSLIRKEEDEAVLEMAQTFSKYGLSFYKTGIGDAVIVKAENDNQIEVDLDTWTEGGAINEAEYLKKFIKDNASPVDQRLKEGATLSDLRAHYFFSERGVDYFSYKEKYDKYQRSMDIAEFLEDAPLELNELSSEEDIKAFSSLYLNGKLRNDADAIREKSIADANSLRGFVNEQVNQQIREDFDVEMSELYNGKMASAAKVGKEYTDVKDSLEAVSIERFGVDLEGLLSYVPKTEEEYNEIIEIATALRDVEDVRRLAVDLYADAATIIDSKFEKQHTDEFVENWEGITNAWDVGYSNGKAAEVILGMSLGIDDILDMSKEEAALAIIKNLEEAQTGKQSRVEKRWHSARGFRESWEVFKNDPAELALSLAAGSLSQMLPYGWKMIVGGAATGAATGAGTGLLGGPLAPVTVTGGAITGAGYGARAGFASASLALEYTNAVLDAARENYDVMDPEQLVAALEDQDVWDKGRELGLKRGIPIAIVDYFSAGLAGRVFKTGSVASKARKFSTLGAERLVFDPAAEALGETAAQVVAGQELNWKEIASESLGAIGNNAPMAAYNVMMDARSRNNVDLASKLTNIGFIARDSSSDTAIIRWAENMKKLGQIDESQYTRIMDNVALRAEAKDVIGVNLNISSGSKVRARMMELLAAKKELTSSQNRREVFSDKIREINDEIKEIANTGKMPDSANQTILYGSGVSQGSAQASPTDIRESVPAYEINGKKYTRDGFLSKLEGMSKEERKKSKINIFNDEVTAMEASSIMETDISSEESSDNNAEQSSSPVRASSDVEDDALVEEIHGKLDVLEEKFLQQGKTRDESYRLALESISEEERQTLRDAYARSWEDTELVEDDALVQEIAELSQELDEMQFQLSDEAPNAERTEELNRKASDLMAKVQPDNVETVEVLEERQGIPVTIEDSSGRVEATGLPKLKLKDILKKKISLLMADKLKIELKDPTKPYDQDTNPYVKMGGIFFPLMEKMFGKVAWASIDESSARKIVWGAMTGDASVVYNMGDGGIDSNIQMIQSMDNAIPADRKSAIFDMIKERVLSSSIKNAHKHFENASSIMEAFKSLNAKEKVDVRAAVARLVMPSTLDVNSQIELHKELQGLGISLDAMRKENEDPTMKSIPTGAYAMVVEVHDDKGVPVRERYLEAERKKDNGEISPKEFKAISQEIAKSAIMSLEQQNSEGIPNHPNYPVYIRGTAKGVMEETAQFFRTTDKYVSDIDKRRAGVEQKIGKEEKAGLTKTEKSIFAKVKEAKKAIEEGNKDKAVSIIESIRNNEAKKLKGEARRETMAAIEQALSSNDKSKIKDGIRGLQRLYNSSEKFTEQASMTAAMTSAMTSASRPKKTTGHFKNQYERFIDRLSKAFPSVEVLTSQDEFDALVENAYAKNLTVKNSKIFGAVYNGKLYLNPMLSNYNTPVHEFGHIWLNTAKELSPELYKRGLALMKEQGNPYVDQVRNNKEYARIIKKMIGDGVSEADVESYVLEEALAAAIGDKGESFVNAAQEKNFKNWLNELFEFIQKLVGISKVTAEQLQDMNLDDFLQAVVVDLMSENEAFAGAEVKSFGEQLQLMALPDESMQKVIDYGRAERYPDAAIKEVLKGRGFKVTDINSAMEINVDLITTLPVSFSRVKGGSIKGQEMFNDVMTSLRKFAKGKKKLIPNPKMTKEEEVVAIKEYRAISPNLINKTDEEVLKIINGKKVYETTAPSMAEVRQKALELLMDHPTFKAQTESVQEDIAIGFDRSIGTKANKKVQDQINNLKSMVSKKRKTMQSIKKMQKELMQSLKELPMSREVRSLMTAVGRLNEDNSMAVLESISSLIDKIDAKEARQDAVKQSLKDRISQMKEDSKYLENLRSKLNRLISNVLPSYSPYTADQAKRVSSIVTKMTAKNVADQVAKVLKIVEEQRAKAKSAAIRRIAKDVAKKAKKKRAINTKIKSGNVDHQGQSFFAEVKKILDLAIANDTDGMIALAQELSDLEGINEVIAKEQSGEKLTSVEQALLDRVYAFDTFADIMSYDLDQVLEMEQSLSDVSKESMVRLKDSRVKRAIEFAETSEAATNQIRDNFKDLFTINGRLKTPRELFKDRVQIRKAFSEGRVWEGLGALIDQYVPLLNISSWAKDLTKEYVMHMTGILGLLDKGGVFFKDNVIRPLNAMDEKYLSGYRDQLSQMDVIANRISGIDGGFKQILKLLRGEGMFVEMNVDNERADLKRIKEGIDDGSMSIDQVKFAVSAAVKRRMEYLGHEKKRVAEQMKIINNGMDSAKILSEQTEFIKAISKTMEINGFDLSKDQLLRMYALSKNEQQRKRLRDLGITNRKLEDIADFLGPQLTEFADNIVDYLSNEYFESINDVHIESTNTNLDRVENYFPTKTEFQAVQPDFNAADFMKTWSSMTPSGIKKRTNTKSAIDLNYTFSSELKTHFQSMERYKAFEIGVGKISKILSIPAVNTLLEETGYKKYIYLQLDNTINPYVTPRSRFTQLQSAFYGIALGFKIMQIPKQASSFVMSWSSYKAKGKPDALMFVLDQLEVLIKFRSEFKKMRGISATFDKRVTDAMAGDIFGLEGGVSLDQKDISKARKYWQTAIASTTTTGDILGVMGYVAVYNRNIKNGMDPAKALEEFNNYNTTQQTKRGTEMSTIQVDSKKNPLYRMVSMFSSALFLQTNLIVTSAANISRDISNGKMPTKRDIRSLYMNMGVANVAFVVAANMFKLTLGDEEDREEVYWSMLEAMFMVNQIGKIPVLGTALQGALNKAKGNNWKSAMVGPLDKAFGDIASASIDEDYFKLGRTVLELLAGANLGIVQGSLGFAGLIDNGSDMNNIYEILGVSKSYRPSADADSKKKKKKEYKVPALK